MELVIKVVIFKHLAPDPPIARDQSYICVSLRVCEACVSHGMKNYLVLELKAGMGHRINPQPRSTPVKPPSSQAIVLTRLHVLSVQLVSSVALRIQHYRGLSRHTEK